MWRRLHCLAGTSLLVLAMPLMAARTPAEPVSPALTAPIAQALDDVQRVPGAFPAMSAVIVQGEAIPWIHVRGQARAPDGPPADPDTRFYLASQTKSFLGLLGAVLDRKRVLQLDTTLADIWPSLRLPAPADPRRITMADLLSHQEGLTTDTLNFLTAYVRDVPAADYPRLLASETVSREPGFRYANLGDLVYGAALEAWTGRNWRDWLDAEVLRALDLDGVTPRTSAVVPARLAWNHQWDGSRWRAFAPKPDALMHAAGGLLASPRAMGRWMQANLGLADARGALAGADFTRAQQPIAHAHLADGEIDCDGYSLGWYSCRYKGQRALMHPGSYVGTVSVTVLVPSAKAGLSLMVNSDSAMEGFELEVMKAFIGLATGQAGESERLRKAVAAYPGRLAKLTGKRLGAIAAARADTAWGGWAWKPDVAQRKACTGRFDNAVYGTLEVQMAEGTETARIGATRLSLDPARPGLFAASAGTMDPPEPFECDGKRIRWHGREFDPERLDGGS
ncbi:MAG: serine hydrolase domain-containing protein [Rhodanobacter sp.]